MRKYIFIALAIAFMSIPINARCADARLIANVLYAEARGESRDGQLMVAQTILDRLGDGRWGDTIYDVVHAPGQYVISRRSTEELLDVAQAALDGERYRHDYIILFFRISQHDRDWWAPLLGRVGVHAYYGYGRMLYG